MEICSMMYTDNTTEAPRIYNDPANRVQKHLEKISLVQIKQEETAHYNNLITGVRV
jgi:hypothetical protein